MRGGAICKLVGERKQKELYKRNIKILRKDNYFEECSLENRIDFIHTQSFECLSNDKNVINSNSE